VEKEERAHDDWFNEARPMTKSKQTWREKRLAREERSSSEETDAGVTEGSDGCGCKHGF
jgi:hypothetical protein